MAKTNLPDFPSFISILRFIYNIKYILLTIINQEDDKKVSLHHPPLTKRRSPRNKEMAFSAEKVYPTK